MVTWGSQSGTATFLSEQLTDELRGAGVDAEAMDQRSVTLDSIKARPKGDILVMMNACFGQGDPTDNAKALYAALTSPESEADARAAIAGRRFAVFGLGSTRSHMAHYQVISRALDARLEELGGVRLLPRGEGDDSGSLEDDFERWIETAIPALKEQWTLKSPNAAAESVSKPSSEEPVALEAFDYEATAAGLGLDVQARVTTIERLCPNDSERPSFCVGLARTDGAPWEFTIGDHVVLLPHSERQATRLAEALGIDSPAFAAAAGGIEYSSPVPRSVIGALAAAAAGRLKTCALEGASDAAKQQAERLASLSAPPPPRGSGLPDPYMDYARSKDGFRSLVEVVLDHQAALRGALTPKDVAAVLAQMPKLRTRSYSVASSPADLGRRGEAEIIVRRVSFATPHHGSQPGVCSSWVTASEAGGRAEDAHAPPSGVVMCSMRSAGFALPEDTKAPLLFIAGGVGIAPFAGFLRHRAAMRAEGAELGEALLIRCSASESDILLRRDVEAALSDGLLSDAVDVVFQHSAASRDRVRLSQASLIGKALQEAGTVEFVRRVLDPHSAGQGFVCGGAVGFGRAVAAGVQQVLEEEWGLTRDGDERVWPVVEALVKAGRWHEDLAD